MLEQFLKLSTEKREAVMFVMQYEILCNTKGKNFESRKLVDRMILELEKGDLKKLIAKEDV